MVGKYFLNMSKIGSKPIKIPESIQLNLEDNTIGLKGKEGEMRFNIPSVLKLKREAVELKLETINQEKKTKSLHGLYRQLISNAMKGLETPWQKILEIVGTGYNVKLQGEDLLFKIGFSHPVIFKKPAGIRFQVAGNNKVIVLGADKQLVGEIAYQIKKLKPPDAYKGKGIRYQGEIIKLKPGKKVKTASEGAA